MLELHEKIEKIQSHNKTWKDFCYRIPIADIFLKKRKKRESDDYDEPIEPLEGVFNTSILVNQAVKQVCVHIFSSFSAKFLPYLMIFSNVT